MIDECAGESDALSHTAGKMMRISISKSLESDEPHEFADFVSSFAQHPAGNEAGLDIAANSEPRKEIRILENETAFRTRLTDCL